VKTLDEDDILIKYGGPNPKISGGSIGKEIKLEAIK
jgi:hypothetical protein